MNSLKHYLFLSVIVLLFFQTGNQLHCQEPERIQNVFTEDAKFGYLLSPGIKLNTVFDKITGEIDFYGGLLINEKILAGVAGGFNIGYPQVNYGYVGIIGQYIYKPVNFIHYSWQTILCYGSLSVDDGNNPVPERSVSDFYMMEPGVNVEINLMRTLRLVTGISYRFVPYRVDQSVPDPFFVKSDLRGLNFRIGIVSGHLLEVLK